MGQDRKAGQDQRALQKAEAADQQGQDQDLNQGQGHDQQSQGQQDQGQQEAGAAKRLSSFLFFNFFGFLTANLLKRAQRFFNIF